MANERANKPLPAIAQKNEKFALLPILAPFN